MFKHSIFDLLMTFSIEEKDRFSVYITSPYFNKGKKMIKLYEEIIKYYPSFNHENLTKENLGRKLNPAGTYKDSAMRKILHELLQLILRFLVLEKFNKMKYVQDDYLLKELTFRNQKKLFKKNEKRIESELRKTDHKNTEYFYIRHLLEANKFNFNILNTKVLKKAMADEEIKEMSECGKYFIIFFITEILNEYIELYFGGSKFNIEYKKLFLCNFIENINIENILKNFLKDDENLFILEIYNSMYKAFLRFENEKYYFDYKNLLLKHTDRICSDEITEHFTNLINYCSIKNRSVLKRKEFEPELMNLYEIILKNNYYITDKVKYFPNDLFKNILFLSLKQKDFYWSLNFVKEFSKKLHTDHIENMYNFGNAYLHNGQNNYERSQEYANIVSYENFNYPFDLKNLKLKNSFELDSSEQIFTEIDSYRKILGYNKMLSSERKNRHHNFLSYLEKIVQYKTGKTKIDISFIKHKLKGEDQILFKEWLLEKIEEIESESVKVG